MGAVQTTRCPDCGFLQPAGATSCPCRAGECPPRTAEVLGRDERQPPAIPFAEQAREPLVPVSEPAASNSTLHAWPGAMTDVGVWRSQPREHLSQPSAERVACQYQEAQIIGRVILIDNTQREPPDFDLCRLLTKMLWILVFLLSPLALFGHTLVVFGPLILVASAGGLVFLLRFLPLGSLIWFACLSFIHRRPDDQIPVCYARVRDVRDVRAQTEVVVRLKGILSRANVAPDDLVSFWGAWHDGVLIPHLGYNHRTNSAVRFRGSPGWIWLILALGFAAALAFHLHQLWTSLNAIVS